MNPLTTLSAYRILHTQTVGCCKAFDINPCTFEINKLYLEFSDPSLNNWYLPKDVKYIGDFKSNISYNTYYKMF